MPDFVEVVFPIPLESTFTYSLPPGVDGHLLGYRVLVPFGKRTMTGYVVGETQPTGEYQVKPIHGVLDDMALLTPTMMGVAKKMCDLYGCTFGEAIQTVLPSGLIKQSKRKVLVNKPRMPMNEPQTLPEDPEDLHLFRKISKSKGLDYLTLLKKNAKSFTVLRRLENQGFIKIESLVNRSRAIEQFDRTYKIRQGADEPKGTKQKALWQYLKEHSVPVSRVELVKQGFAYALSALLKRKLVEEIMVPKQYGFDASFVSAPKLLLSSQQQEAILCVDRAMEERSAEKFLLFGITGSGKTEVYLQAAAKAIERGKSVMALVPEIALTPQFVGRFRARFGDRISVLHSGRSESERLTEWKRIRRGEADIVIGPRSVVFAPVENLGLVIIDEEHDASYKQEDGLAYHVKHLAYFRAKQDRAVILLGSATPSIESFELARQGKLKLLNLPNRMGDFGLPSVEIVDLRKDFSKFGEKGILSEALRNALEETLTKKHQAVLFMNRRGFAPLVLCPSCGEFVQCEQCSVAMTYHRDKAVLLCHYCDATKNMAMPCIKCGHLHLVQLGMGTEKVEDELNFYFPDAKIARMDRDTVDTKGAHERILRGFSQGKTDILLGTQMVTKGLDVENVTLVGVLLADQSLHFPDFRSSEITFQLLTQVAGRAGRGKKEGRAIFQTFLPENYAVLCAKEQNYLAFFEKEIVFRKELNYPPFSSLSLIELSSNDETEVRTFSMWMREQAQKTIKAQQKSTISILGPAPCPIKKIQNRFRYQMLVRSNRGMESAKFAKWLVSNARQSLPSQAIRIKLNIDPHRFM
ncbi:MAG: primosomal protein N' [Bdellovibrionales bacterium]|nr:primosomal protein N' [Bdellovibrionales bacterium]